MDECGFKGRKYDLFLESLLNLTVMPKNKFLEILAVTMNYMNYNRKHPEGYHDKEKTSCVNSLTTCSVLVDVDIGKYGLDSIGIWNIG